MGDLKVGEGFIDAVMIRVTATGAAALGLAPTCTLTRLSTGARVGLTVAEVSDGIYKVTDMAPGADDEYLTEWAVAGLNTIYTAFKLFKVGGGVIADWENGGRLDLIIDTLALEATLAVVDGLVDDIIADIGGFPTANYATLAAYVEDIRTRLIAIVADTGAIVWGDVTTIKGLVDSAEAVGPYSYLDAGGEQDVYEDAVVTRRRIWIEVSNRNMTLAGTFITYRKVDGANYDVWTTQPTTVGAGDDRVFDAEFTTNQHWKITYEESADEGAARAIPYNVITQVIE